jgi:hypothetical protein
MAKHGGFKTSDMQMEDKFEYKKLLIAQKKVKA